MRKLLLPVIMLAVSLVACNDDNDDNSLPQTIAPSTYEFNRNGATTVDYNGQTTRIQMGEEFVAALLDDNQTLGALNGMFAHTEGNSDFSNADLNASSKNLRSKVAASNDYFFTNSTAAAAIKGDFDSWIVEQVNAVFPHWKVFASAGLPGQIQEAGGGPIRYVNAKGIEMNQIIGKGLIGGLMVDQMLNNYLSTSVLDAGNNRADNDAEILVEGKNYTNMEHKWDEAFGYLYGTDNAVNPQLGADSFLNKYLGRVENDPDFTGIADAVYNAFKLGRAAIVNKDYATRDQQAELIRGLISEVIAIRAVYYLQQGKLNIAANDYGAAFHDLSEGIGFIYSLQFTRQPTTLSPYFTIAEVDDFIGALTVGNGFWDVTSWTLENMSESIAARFNFTVEEAAN